MTTLRDLLNDFAYELLMENADDTKTESIQEIKERMIDEYIEAIKERIVG